MAACVAKSSSAASTAAESGLPPIIGFTIRSLMRRSIGCEKCWASQNIHSRILAWRVGSLGQTDPPEVMAR